MYLYHYYDNTIGPFRSLSDVATEDAKLIMENIRTNKPEVQCAKRHSSYIEDRLHYESILREKFKEKGGIIERFTPHYMVIEHSPWLSTWFEHCAFIKIPIEAFDLSTISFTYGDSHPTFSPRVTDNKEYRKKLYFYDEMLELIEKYGLPQNWNNDGKYGPERYIEAHIWSDRTIQKYKQLS